MPIYTSGLTVEQELNAWRGLAHDTRERVSVLEAEVARLRFVNAALDATSGEETARAETLRAEVERLRARAVVWADEASPFDGPQVKALLDENERLRAELRLLADSAHHEECEVDREPARCVCVVAVAERLLRTTAARNGETDG